MTNAEIARVFDHIAIMLEMDGGNPFRVRAYREAARVIEHLAEPAASLARSEGRLQQIKGIGKDLEGKIRDIAATGTTSTYTELSAKYPPSLMELTGIQGLGPKRVKALFTQLGVRSLDDLAQAARGGKIKDLPGFGETVERKVLDAVEKLAAAPVARMLIHAAWPVAGELTQAIGRVPGVEQVEVAGSFRRRRETIGDLDLLVCGGEASAVMAAFTGHAYVAEVLARGETKSSVRLGNGLQVDLRLVPAASFGAAMMYFTGSKSHNIELRKLALERGMTLNEYGLTTGERVVAGRTQGERLVAGRTEEEVYRALELDWIPPELREAHDEIELARQGGLPRLVEESDLHADLHMHTDRSDGRDSLVDMVRAARERGYEYCAITDHSKALGMTRGFDDARVEASIAEIEAVRRDVPGITVLHGLEVDILADGQLDLGEQALAKLDWVIVSLHSSLAQPRDVITARVLRAIEHPAVHLMGHPSGRKIGARNAADLDFERVFERAAELGVAMEINGQPDRMDLSDRNARLAKERGVRFTIDTDSHSTANLGDYIRYGLFQARRAGLTREDVLNAQPFAAFDAWRRGPRRPSTPVAPATVTKPTRRAKPKPDNPPAKPPKPPPKPKSKAIQAKPSKPRPAKPVKGGRR